MQILLNGKHLKLPNVFAHENNEGQGDYESSFKAFVKYLESISIQGEFEELCLTEFVTPNLNHVKTDL